MGPVFVIVNPQAGKGRGVRLLAPFLESVRATPEDRIEHAATERPGHEETLTREALVRGFRTIVAVGGDGTWGNVAHAMVASGIPARLALVGGGTGCDFAKSFAIPVQDPVASARVVRQGTTRRIDVGRIENRHFLNVAGFGFDIAVIEDSRRIRYLSGGILYFYCALRQLRSFPGFRVEMSVDEGPFSRRDLLMLVVANGKVFGGGFRIAPWSNLDDGALEAVGFDNMGLAGRVPAMIRLIRGSHRGARAVSTASGKRFRLRFERPPTYETDGEWRQAGQAELTIETIPKAIEILVPSSAGS